MTHTLVGAGVGRLLSPRREWIPQLSAAGVAASMLQDADSWLYLLGPNYYGLYHRVASHNLWALAIVALASASLAWALSRFERCRRFGWFVTENLPPTEPVPRAPWLLLLAVSVFAAYLHLAFDIPTGFGNLWPLWPWSTWDVSLHAVTSFDVVIFGCTMGWHVYLRQSKGPCWRDVSLSALYALVIVVYVIGCLAWGKRTVW